jgi:YtkA-like
MHRGLRFTRPRLTAGIPILAFLVTTLAAAGCGQPDATTQATPAGEPVAASGQPSPEGLDITLTTDPDPVRTGENVYEVVVKDRGKPVADASVSTEFFMAAMPSMNMPEMRNKTDLTHVGQGVYRGTGQIIMGGNWDVTVKVMRGDREIGRRKFTTTAR